MNNNFTTNEIGSTSLNNLLSSSSKNNIEIIKDIRLEINNKSSNNTVITEIYKDLLRAIISIFSKLVYRDEQENLINVPCWHGSSERVISKMKQKSNLILPIVSIFRSNDSLVDNNRRRTDNHIIFEKYFDKVKNRAVRVASIASTPVDINYRISVWTKYQEDMDQLSEQIRRYFNPDLLIPTKHNNQTVSFLKEESSNVDVSLPDGQDRIIRRAFEVVVQSYIPNPKFVITNTGKIETLNTELYVPLK